MVTFQMDGAGVDTQRHTFFSGLTTCDVIITTECTECISLLTSLAIETAEPLVEVLLILHTDSVLSEGQIFKIITGPLRRRRFCCMTHLHDEGYRQ